MPTRLIAALALAGLLAAGCNAAVADKRERAFARIEAEVAARPPGKPITINVVAKNIAFEPTTEKVQVNTPVTLVFDNQDNAVQHNIHVEAGASGDFKTPVAAGPGQQSLEFTLKRLGTVRYVCDVHPQMVGTISAR
jgi:plastocyanin